MSGGEDVFLNDVDDIFSKWENKVIEKEIIGNCTFGNTDDLAARFEDDEEKEELMSMLKEIRIEEENS